ncbi:MAG: hypothetical protein AAFN08_04635 [Cyanobacteria bacterium J06559_3]
MAFADIFSERKRSKADSSTLFYGKLMGDTDIAESGLTRLKKEQRVLHAY